MTEFPTGTQRSSYTEGWHVAYSSLNSEIIQTFESASNPPKNRKIEMRCNELNSLLVSSNFCHGRVNENLKRTRNSKC